MHITTSSNFCTAVITSINVLPSKNQALCEYCTHVGKLKHCLQSREKRLITKEHIVTHKHLNFIFKQALNFNTVAIKFFNSSAKLKLLNTDIEYLFSFSH